MTDLEKLPVNVLVAVRLRLGAECGADDSLDGRIRKMNARQLFDAYCDWEGLIGFGDTLIQAWEGIQKAVSSE